MGPSATVPPPDVPVGPPPGWYPDPSGAAGLRWWDGYSWTPYSAPPPAVAWNPVQLVKDERRMTGWATAAVVAWLVAGIASIVFILASSSRWGPYSHQLHVLWHDMVHGIRGRRLPQVRGSPDPPWLSVLAGAVTVAAVPLVLVWQHRSASTARALGYPAHHSPGWGVGCWFVPVVNFWMPCQAIRDTLAPQDPARRRVLAMWLLFLSAEVLSALLNPLVWWAGGGWILAWCVVRLLILGALAVVGIPLFATIASRHSDTARAVLRPFNQAV